jgi:CRP-like cAMP-binding protein
MPQSLPSAARTPLRSRLPSQVWDALLRDLATESAEPGDRIGGSDRNDSASAVIEGAARVYLLVPGGRHVTTRYVHAGELAGIPPLFTTWDGWRAEAVLPTTYATIPLARIRSLMSRDSAFLRAVAEEAASIAADAIHRLIDSQNEPMTVRVASDLLELAAPRPDGHVVAVVTHQRLADATGTAREVVTRVLRQFRAAGAIRTGPGIIEILDRDRLLQFAGGKG